MAMMGLLMINAAMSLLFIGVVLVIVGIILRIVVKNKARRNPYQKHSYVASTVFLVLGICFTVIPTIFLIYIYTY